MPDPADLRDEPLADDESQAAAGTGAHATDGVIADAPLLADADELSDTLPHRAIIPGSPMASGVSLQTFSPPVDPPLQAQAAAAPGEEAAREWGDAGLTGIAVGKGTMGTQGIVPDDDPELTIPGRPQPTDLLEPREPPDRSLKAATSGRCATSEHLRDALEAFRPQTAAPEPTSTPMGVVEEQALTGLVGVSTPASTAIASALAPAPLDLETEGPATDQEMADDNHVPAEWGQQPELVSGEDEPTLAPPGTMPELEPQGTAAEPEPAFVSDAFEQSLPYSAALVEATEAGPTHSALAELEAFAAPPPGNTAQESAFTREAPPAKATPVDTSPPPPTASYLASQLADQTHGAYDSNDVDDAYDTNDAYDAYDTNDAYDPYEAYAANPMVPPMVPPTVPLYEEPLLPVLPPVVDVSAAYSQVPSAYWIQENPLEDTRYHLGLTGARPVVREAGRPLPQPRRFRRPARWRSFLMLLAVSVLVAFACGAALSVGVQMLTRPPAAPTAIPTHTNAPQVAPSP